MALAVELVEGVGPKIANSSKGSFLEHVKKDFISIQEKAFFFYGWDLSGGISNHFIDKEDKKCSLISIRDKPFC